MHPTGNVLLAGVSATAQREGVITLRELGGKLIWQAPLDRYVAVTRFEGLHVKGDGHAAVYLSNGAGTDWGFAFFGVDPGGEETYMTGQGSPGVFVTGGPMVVKGNVAYVLNKAHELKGTTKGKLLESEFTGFELGKGARADVDRVMTPAFDVRGAIGVKDRFVWWGPKSGDVMQVGVLDALGNPMWQRGLAVAPKSPTTLAASVDGERFVLMGADSSGGKQTAKLVVVDRWAKASCVSRGNCADQSWASCDDGKGCTNDSCSAITGCQHTPEKTNICDPSIPCTSRGHCQTGVCQRLDKGRTYIAGYPGATLGAGGLTLDDKGAPVVWRVFQRQNLGESAAALTGASLDKGSLQDIGEFPLPHVIGGVNAARNALGVYAAVAITRPGKHAELRAFVRDKYWQADPVASQITAPGCTTCNPVVSSLVASPDGSFYAGGTGTAGGGTGYLGKVLNTGKLAWRTTVRIANQPTAFHGLVALANTSVMGIGEAISAGKKLGAVVTYSSVGKIEAAFYSAQQNAVFKAGVHRNDGTVVLAGFVLAPNTLGRSLVGAWTATGKPLWQKLPLQDDAIEFNGMVKLGDGGVVLSGKDRTGGATALHLRRLSGDGAVVWQRSRRMNDAYDIHAHDNAIRQLADGGFAMAVRVPVPEANLVLDAVARTDASGFLSCVQAGKCGELKTASCDDGNPCTVDFCDAAKGCQHGPIEGLACGVGGVCKAGKCSK